MRTSNTYCGNEAGLVQKFIGSAYDVVKNVYDNLDAIKEIDAHIVDVINLYKEIDKIRDVYDKLPELTDLQQNLPQLVDLHTNLSKFIELHANLTKLLSVANSIQDVRDVAANMQELLIVSKDITAVKNTSMHINAVLTVANGMQNIIAILPDMPSVNSVGANISSVVNIDTYLAQLLVIENNIDELLEFGTPLLKIVNTSFSALRRSYLDAGLYLVNGSFEDGATVYRYTDVVLFRRTGDAYRWSGTIPSGGLVIPKDSTPDTAGGVGYNAWVNVRDSVKVITPESIGAERKIPDYYVDRVLIGDGSTGSVVFMRWGNMTTFRLETSAALARITSGPLVPIPAKYAPAAHAINSEYVAVNKSDKSIGFVTASYAFLNVSGIVGEVASGGCWICDNLVEAKVYKLVINSKKFRVGGKRLRLTAQIV